MNLVTLHRILLAALVGIPLLAACISRPGIVRETGMVNTEKSHPVIPRYEDKECTITIKELHLEEWQNLLENTCFTTRQQRVRGYRLPPLHFFQLIVTNRSGESLYCNEITLQYGNTIKQQITAPEMKKNYTSPLYDIFNFKSIFSWRRELAEKRSDNSINYDRDTIELKGSVIPAKSSAYRIVAFNWIPVQNRKFTLRLQLKTGERKKIIDFKLVKSEYRTKGKHFLKNNGKEK
jgi:hypothetical protein